MHHQATGWQRYGARDVEGRAGPGVPGALENGDVAVIRVPVRPIHHMGRKPDPYDVQTRLVRVAGKRGGLHAVAVRQSLPVNLGGFDADEDRIARRLGREGAHSEQAGQGENASHDVHKVPGVSSIPEPTITTIRGEDIKMDSALAWDGNWAWSLPLIVVTVILHVIGLAFINERLVQAKRIAAKGFDSILVFALVMGITTLLVTLLHAGEAAIWAAMYWILGGLPDGKSALLYSLGAMTTYGHQPLYLADHWHLMGALEALNGMILFGLTTAFLFSMIREVWPAKSSAAVV
jgi:hypothetical protein